MREFCRRLRTNPQTAPPAQQSGRTTGGERRCRAAGAPERWAIEKMIPEYTIRHATLADYWYCYRLTFEDASNPNVEKTGEELSKGLEVTLKGAPLSELIFLVGIPK